MNDSPKTGDTHGGRSRVYTGHPAPGEIGDDAIRDALADLQQHGVKYVPMPSAMVPDDHQHLATRPPHGYGPGEPNDCDVEFTRPADLDAYLRGAWHGRRAGGGESDGAVSP